MTTVAEAKQQLAHVKACMAADAKKAEELQAIVDAEQGLIATVDVVHDTFYSFVDILNEDVFPTYEQRNAYAEAIDTLLLLQKQPGTQRPNGSRQYLFEYNFAGNSVDVDWYQSIRYKYSFIGPCFTTKEYAERALWTVGKDRIIRMILTLHGGV